jgi:plasmid stabilization system protein ParE
MALGLKWSKNAERKFDLIIEYLKGKWGLNVAKKFTLSTLKFLELLQEFPELGTNENPNSNIFGFVISEQKTLFYKIKGNNIVVMNFYDNRQKPKKNKISTTTK